MAAHENPKKIRRQLTYLVCVHLNNVSYSNIVVYIYIMIKPSQRIHSNHSLPMASFHFLVLLLTLLVVQLSQATRPSLFSSTNDFSIFNSTKWAVLVAGSSGYYNYRHQVCISSTFSL